jgi:hypothetical protein
MSAIRRIFLGASLLFAGVSLAFTSCSSVDAAFDCQRVCNRYKECFNSGYDVGACRDRCRSNAERDMEAERKADQCEACIDDRSCSEATFNCAADCAGIVP